MSFWQRFRRRRSPVAALPAPEPIAEPVVAEPIAEPVVEETEPLPAPDPSGPISGVRLDAALERLRQESPQSEQD